MAKGFDALIDFLLSEIALCGVQGAGSKEFHRFIEKFYYELRQDGIIDPSDLSVSCEKTVVFDRSFYDKVWKWVTNHSDIRISDSNGARELSLSEFEALETQNSNSTAKVGSSSQSTQDVPVTPLRPSSALSSLGSSIRQRLLAEADHSTRTFAPQVNRESSRQVMSNSQGLNRDPGKSGRLRRHRNIPEDAKINGPVFDDPPQSLTAPRLFASQNCIWQAITGHSIDLKRVPAMEFVLLCIIAAHGSSGISQPDLVKASGQDKRSVPHRTDELTRKGYIEKKPFQSGKLRTSLCIHKKFIKDDHFLNRPQSVDEVFGVKTFFLPGFVQLLHTLLKDVNAVPTRDLRKRMGVSMQRWNGRAVRGAILRLEQTGFLKRIQALKKGPRENRDKWLVCIKLLRDPIDEDIKNLGFRKIVSEPDQSEHDLPEEGEYGDSLDRDMELEIMDIDNNDDLDEIDRVPPQWTPDRLLPNIVYDAVAMTGIDGVDSAFLRDRSVGIFWKRPLEALVSRLTDNWEKSQPHHLRHLAIIRDTGITEEKKFVHYIYRTHGNFQKAVDAGDVQWEGVSKDTTKGKISQNVAPLDAWGFQSLNANDFLRRSGSATLVECRSAIVHGRRYGQNWDKKYKRSLGSQQPGTPRRNHQPQAQTPGQAITSRLAYKAGEHQVPGSDQGLISPSASANEFIESSPFLDRSDTTNIRQEHATGPVPLITPEQRQQLGLPLHGRLSKDVQGQIQAHRHRTGDPTSIPSVIIKKEIKKGGTSPKRNSKPILTREERRARGLPERGRLGKALEDQIRREKGMIVKSTRQNKHQHKYLKESPLLTMEQRVARGLPRVGRLPASLIAELRRQRDMRISPDPTLQPAEHTSIANDTVQNEEDTISHVVPSIEQPPRPTLPLSAFATPSTFARKKRSADEINDDLQTTAKRVCLGSQAVDTEPVFGSVPDRVESRENNSQNNSKQESANGSSQTGTKENGTIAAAAAASSSFALLPTPDTNTYPSTAILSSYSRLNDIGPSMRAALSQQPLSGSELRSQQIKVTYVNRTEPGVYIDPFATRSMGRGRPRKAFIASFKLPRLRELAWFIPDADSSRIITSAPPTGNQIQDATRPDPVQTASPRVSQIPSSIMSIDSIPEPSTHLAANFTEGEMQQSRARSSHSEASSIPTTEHHLIVGDEHPAQPLSNMREPTTLGPMKSISDDAASRFSPDQPRLMPIGWNAINNPTLPQSATYHSPYGLPPSVKPFGPTEVAEGVQSGIGDNASKIATLSEAAAPEDDNEATHVEDSPRSGSQVPKKKGTSLSGRRTVVLGKGNLWRSRTSIIRYILELCKGAFPGDGEIIPVFEEVWKERAPKKLICPERTTIGNALKSMVDDPKENLKRWTYYVPGVTDGVTKKKTVVAYKHLDPQGPEIRTVRDGIIKAYPHRYFPPEISQYAKEERWSRKGKTPEIDETVTLASTGRGIEKRIRDSIRKRRQEAREKRVKEAERRKIYDAKLEQDLSKASKNAQSTGGGRSKRLVSLNDKGQSKRKVFQQPTPDADGIEEEEIGEGDYHAPTESLHSPAPSDDSGDETLAHPSSLHFEANKAKQFDQLVEEGLEQDLIKVYLHALMAPATHFYSTSGTFSTDFYIDVKSNWMAAFASTTTPAMPISTFTSVNKGLKRVRIEEPPSEPSHKKRRVTWKTPIVLDGAYVDESSSNSEESPNRVFRKHLGGKRDKFSQVPVPTLVERLTGLTGNPNDPDYQPPKKKQKTWKTWEERKETRRNRPPREKRWPESTDPVDKFKKLCYTLVIALSMSRENGTVDWSIVSKAYSEDRSFELVKAKKTLSWMQNNFSDQLKILIESFQSSFLEAYEAGKVASIEDPETYDWANLARWAVQHCKYPETPLPLAREALGDYEVDISNHQVLDRAIWYKDNVSYVRRAQGLLQYSFAVPLSQSSETSTSMEDSTLKARTWIRANISTPNALYNKKMAHDKLRVLSNPVLETVVSDLVHTNFIRMWKLKRQRPGRNYLFTPTFAKNYRRTLELEDFMNAVKLKKELDTAFSNVDSSKRAFSISRSADDGSVMAILSLVGDGKVKLVPRLPPINNNSDAPLPRLSVWGFCEGEYTHRSIDRQRLFWQIDAVPTDTYEFGSPLQPIHLHSNPEVDGSPTDWQPLPEPPLPGRHRHDALLPIWSSISGQTVTWPWWNRILNLVLQIVMFQPGVTISEIFQHCPEHTIEIFEIELVLDWLVSVKAVKRTPHDTFEVLPGFWAAFGDRLIDDEDDDFGKSVKRPAKNKKLEPTWRTGYNFRFSTLQRDNERKGSVSDDNDADSDMEDDAAAVADKVFKDRRNQYSIAKKALRGRPPRTNPAREEQAEDVVLIDSGHTAEDVDMIDADPDAEGEYLDAEGESDDEIMS